MAVDVDESMLLLDDCLVVSDQKVGIKKFTAKEHALTLSLTMPQSSEENSGLKQVSKVRDMQRVRERKGE